MDPETVSVKSGMGGTTTAGDHFRFFDLPAELRNDVYKHVFDPANVRSESEDGTVTYHFDVTLFRVSSQLYFESRKIFYQTFTFARVETPWFTPTPSLTCRTYDVTNPDPGTKPSAMSPRRAMCPSSPRPTWQTSSEATP